MDIPIPPSLSVKFVSGFASAPDEYHVYVGRVLVGVGETPEAAVADIATRLTRADEYCERMRTLIEQAAEISGCRHL